MYEEYGFVTEDGLRVKIMSFLGFKTMEWINEDEASEIGIKTINRHFYFAFKKL